MSEQNITIPSPIATGLSGGFFEQHVGASWLSLLLVRGIPPILLDSQVTKVAFQTRRLGWETDDILVIGEAGDKKVRKLICQVKRSFTVSKSNEECRKTFLSFWKDFNSDRFNIMTDRLCLISLKGTNNLLVHLASLFEAASHSASFADFNQRLSVQGLLHSTAKTYAADIRKVLEEDKILVTDEDYWKFLQSISVLSFDLNTQTSQTESWIKSMLALTANTADKVGTAKSTWDSLLEIVSKAMSASEEILFDNIPESIRKVHGSVSTVDTEALWALQSHSAVVLKGIHNSINNKITLERDEIVSSVLDKLKTNKVVVLSGPAGVGKSAISKKIIQLYSSNTFTLSFRAEEFAKTHIDETLRGAGFGMSADKLFSLLAAQGQKIILIESAERLLEASERESFKDLLNFLEKDNSWDVVITCRSYSLDIFTSSFLGHGLTSYSIVDIPQLTDEELQEVKSRIPELALPLSNEKLVKVLRIPFVLDKAAKMSWKEPASLPSNEREFRRLFWKEIVREDSKAKNGLPLKREQALTQVALRRARSLSVYANCDDLDQLALQKLRQSDLIIASENTDLLTAPAHDVLEDWVLLHWLESINSQVEGVPEKLAEEIGGYPALRRSYRMWLSEKSNLSPLQTDEYVSKVLKSSSLTAHFRDDTMVSILRADTGAEFILRNRTILFEKNAYLLKRVVHLLRVSCKSMPTWLKGTSYLQSSIMVPVGTAWVATLILVNESLEEFLKNEPGLLLGFIEDWVNLVEIHSSNPEGTREAAIIAFRLLEVSLGYRQDKVRKKIFTVLSKIPAGDSESFLKILEKGKSGDRDAEDFLDFLVEGYHSAFVARDFPDELIDVFKNRVYLSVKKKKTHELYERMEVESFFGIKGHRNFYPASALRGPFFTLLQNHFKIGIDYIIEFSNYAASAYANPPAHDRLEPPWEVELTFADGNKTKQWHNPRLWQLYRGTSVGPYVLMSALMAMEKFLLNIGKGEAKHLDDWLIYILRNSNNSSLTAVVSSVVVAYPFKCKEASKVLLSCRDFIEIDQNMSFAGRASSLINEMFPSLDAESKFYESERKEADGLPHRSKHLAMIALELQVYGMGKEIQNIIDTHLSHLPAAKMQSEHDKMWRFLLHKMDTRKYLTREATDTEKSNLRSSKNLDETVPEELKSVVLEPMPLEKDIKDIIDRDQPKISMDQDLIGMFNWALSCFSRDGKSDEKLWSFFLTKAISIGLPNVAHEYMSWNDAPSIVAAVCARDHWLELTDPQKEWCLHALEKSIQSNLDNMNHIVHVSVNSMSSDRPSAHAVSAVIAHERNSDFRVRALVVLANSLFHSCEEVTKYAAAGVGEFLWGNDQDLVQRSVNAIVYRAIRMSKDFEEDFKKDYNKRGNPYLIQANINTEVRNRFKNGDLFKDSSLDKLDFRARWTTDVFYQLLHILNPSLGASGDLLKAFYESIAAQLCEWWTRDKKDESVPYELMYVYMDKLADYVLRLEPSEAITLCDPILNLIGSHPRDTGKFFEDLVRAEDTTHFGKDTFWAVWKEFGDRVKKATWIKKLDSDYFHADEIFRPLFLGLRWKKGVRSWKPHLGYENYVLDLFKDLPVSSTVLDYVSEYLYTIGDMTLPKGFVMVSDKIKGADIKANSNTAYCLEQTMQRHVYGTPQKLKSDPAIREAVINILDFLVDSGSSAAFKMRDDFVTPILGLK